MESIKYNYGNPNGNFESFSESITSIQAIAIFGAITYHIDPRFILYMTIGGDIYIFLSGMLLTIILLKTKNKNFSWKIWYKRRIIRIYPALILTTSFILLYQFLRSQVVYDFNSILIHMSGFQSIPGNPNFELIDGPHWFITLILICYIIFPFFFILIRKNFKLMIYLSIGLYILYIPFFNSFYKCLEETLFMLIQRNISLFRINEFIPRIFTFFFGILFGFWIEKNENKKINILQSNKIGLISFISLFISLLLYLIFIFYTFGLENVEISNYYFKERVLFQPLITIFFIIFSLFFFCKLSKINKFLKIPGKESYEIIMIHTIPMIIVLYVLFTYFSFFDYNTLIVLSNILTFTGSIILAYPFYYVGQLIKNNKKTHKLIIFICLGLILYAIISYSISIFNLFELNNFISFFLLLLIIINLIFLNVIRFFFNKKVNFARSKKMIA